MASFFDIKARAANAAASSSKLKQSPATAERAQPWVEKYRSVLVVAGMILRGRGGRLIIRDRPKDLSEVKAQDHVVDVLRRMLNYGNMPHLLLYGSPGNGKTSTILALARSLYGPQLFRSRVLELNASDERGISIIRTNVKVKSAFALDKDSNITS